MVSKEQQQKIDKRIMEIARSFLEYPAPIWVVAERLGLSRSTVQRDLNNRRLDELIGQGTCDKIKGILDNNIVDGRKRGGLVSTNKNEVLKGKHGKFCGCRKIETKKGKNR